MWASLAFVGWPTLTMKLLIVTRPSDGHTAAVNWALTQAGIDPVVWIADAFPSKQSLSCRIRNNRSWSTSLCAQEEVLSWDEAAFDVVWLRRLSAPMLEGEISEIDRPFAESESWVALRSALAAFQDCARWVNPLLAKERALYKLAQLTAAVSSGLTIPETVATNDRQVALDFITAVGRPVVAKQFAPIEWLTNNGTAKSRTRCVAPEDLRHWRPRELAPTIFQTAIEKAYEVRITVMGDELIGARLDVQGDGAGHIDWRLSGPSGQSMHVQPWQVPGSVRGGILKLMQRLGLVFGCIDAIVSPDGEFVFLEVNEMGQFLWLDDQCPELSLLEKFCSFLVYGDCSVSSEFPDSQAYGRSGHWPAYRLACERKYGTPSRRYVGVETAS